MRNTLCSDSVTLSVEDHPHIHGEYSLVLGTVIWSEGSPPHTWGIQIPAVRVAGCTRITPTYMGNTAMLARVKRTARDHPHIHGEYVG